MIEVKDLTKLYGQRVALDGISFEAQSGEIVGLLGPNGAGKTTTMRILTGFMPPTSGTAIISGYDVLQDSLAVRQRVGYMPEQVPIYPEMTVRAYVMYWAKLRGVKRPRARVDEVLQQFALDDRADQLTRALSKGLRQRLGLAQATVHDPEVIILDEPTIGIDPKQVIEVRQFVRSLSQRHTVLFSSHILSEVEQVCDRVVILNAGKVIASGTTALLSRQIKPGTHLYIRTDADQTQALLEAIDAVEAVHPQDQGYILTSGSDTDLRPAVTRTLAQHNITLLEMRPVEVTLEDIFLNLLEKEQ